MTGTQSHTTFSFLCTLWGEQAGCKVEVVEGGFRCRKGAGNNGGNIECYEGSRLCETPKNYLSKIEFYGENNGEVRLRLSVHPETEKLDTAEIMCIFCLFA